MTVHIYAWPVGLMDKMMGEEPNGQEAAGQESDSDSLVSDIQEKLNQLSSVIDATKGLTPKDKQSFSQIKDAFDSFVQENLAQEQNQDAPEEPAPDSGVAPMMAGAKSKVEPAL